MKKFLVAVILIVCNMQFAKADESIHTANIKINIAGTNQQNTYFLCLQGIGCLSIHAAQKGKIYPVTHDIAMDNMYVVNQNTMELYKQGLPASCHGDVKVNQTVTISGKLVQGVNNTVHVSQFRCTVSG
ncbi:MAG: hypothetical protein WAW86_05880 [Gammaproteobacteria bacterium]